MRSTRPDPARPGKLSWRDIYQMVTSVLMVILGPVILARTVGRAELLLPALSGAGILALGLYRLALIRRTLARRSLSRTGLSETGLPGRRGE